MPELAYILNHWVTVVWLALAGIYVYYAVIADLVAMVRGSKRERDKRPGP